ncbi:MAG: hypothetical protein KJ799_00985 [Bacteroidetes bacterium]|nr:hypothetical protein [Bacteroidota bacterium]MBU2505292.1 hypothetical protein [Bacteroidota bacterium]
MKNKENVTQNLDWYLKQSLETQISLFGNFLEVAKLLANQILEDEVNCGRAIMEIYNQQ